MQINKIYNEPCLETLKKMQDKSIDCVITSPPYWQLRDYGYDGQWGLEPTFQEFLQHLWEMMDEIYRVLKDEGTCWVNLGDSFSTQSGTNAALARGRNYQSDSTYIINRGESGKLMKDKSLPNKCLMLIPHRFAIGCIDRGWILRNDIIWAKRNGMPESVTDRFTKKHEYIFFMVKSEKYYFDLNAIKDKSSGNRWGGDKFINKNSKYNDTKTNGLNRDRSMNIDGFKNPGTISDFWDIVTKGSSDSHYASYNTDLIKKPILSGCPEGGIIYDPFMGTGTTAMASLRANRNFIGSEMSTEYIKICEQNIKPLLMQSKLF